MRELRTATLQRRAPLPEGIQCFTTLGYAGSSGAASGAIVVGSAKGVQLILWADAPSQTTRSVRCAAPREQTLHATGFSATCLVSLGSQSLAAGDEAGVVRVWHWRRRELKQVFQVAAHTAALRALANGGDVLFTASGDGTVRQLNVLEDFACNDFFSAGQAVHSIVARGKNVLVGCSEGCIWELARRNAGPRVLRQLQMGIRAPIVSLDADPPGPGGRILALAGERLAVWVDPPGPGERGGAAGEKCPEPEGSWPALGATAALLLPGSGVGDHVTLGSAGLNHGPGCHALSWPSEALALQRPSTLVRGSTEDSIFFMAAESPDTAVIAAFELVLTPTAAKLFEDANGCLMLDPAADVSEGASTMGAMTPEGTSLDLANAATDGGGSVDDPTIRPTVPGFATALGSCSTLPLGGAAGIPSHSGRASTKYLEPTEASRLRQRRVT